MRGLYRRQLWMAAILAGGLSALALSWALAAPKAGFLHLATNLSQNPDRPSYYADIAVSPDGDRVAVVWTEMQSGLREGSVLLRWASESTGSGWSAPITVFSGGSGAGAVWAAVAVTGTNPYTAYVAYVVQNDNTNTHYIYYRACSLSGGGCGEATVITSRNPARDDPGFGMVDIALGGGSNPHFAYVYYRRASDLGRDVGTVYYKGPLSSNEEEVSDGYDARNPAIAWNNGAVHIVWETVPKTGADYYIFHRRRIGTGWSSLNSLIRQGMSYAPHNPAVAVFSSTVMVVWDMNRECSQDQECYKFTLAYIRSTNNGQGWPVHSGMPAWFEVNGDIWGTDHLYTSTSGQEEYITYLRPSVGFMGDGKPVIVWHVNDGTKQGRDYNLYHTRALTVPADAGSAIGWAAIERFGQNIVGRQAAPVIAPYLPLSVPHVVYMASIQSNNDWETYYDGNEYDRYSRVFLPIIMRNFSGGE